MGHGGETFHGASQACSFFKYQLSIFCELKARSTALAEFYSQASFQRLHVGADRCKADIEFGLCCGIAAAAHHGDENMEPTQFDVGYAPNGHECSPVES